MEEERQQVKKLLRKRQQDNRENKVNRETVSIGWNEVLED